MKVSDFVIKETVTNSGEKTYIIGRMQWKQPISFLQLIGIKKCEKVFDPVGTELETSIRCGYIYRPIKIITFNSVKEAEKYIAKKIKEKHDRQIKSERIIEIH